VLIRARRIKRLHEVSVAGYEGRAYTKRAGAAGDLKRRRGELSAIDSTHKERVMSSIVAQMASNLSQSWWLLLLRGIAAIVFGLLIWFQPGISLAAMVLVFGVYVFIDGIFGVWTAITSRKQDESWWVLLLWGLLGIGVGVLTFMNPGLTALALLFYIAIWAIATGVLEIVAAVRLRKEITGEFWLILAGLASVVFGVLIIWHPGPGALAVLWLIAAYAIVFGILLVILAFRARGFVSRVVHAAER
jgi:uncharacterized membrane protein HdeD (DUF308 family)